MSSQEEAPNYTKQSHSFYFRSSFQVTHGPTEFSGASMSPVTLRVDQLKLNHMYNIIINGIAPSYLKSDISIAGHTGHVTRSGNRACFVPRVNSFAIDFFFQYRH